MKTDKNIMDVYFQSNENYTIRREQLNGIDHIVVPVVMMVEGVHTGSHGPILHLAEELGRYPESWDGIPVTIGHPFVNGQYVSANKPDILQDWAVGRIFNTQITDAALKAEAWLEEATLERVSETTFERINNGEIIEVSIGIFSDEEMVSGIWNNERYVSIARNHRPNHLALLPDEVGACSIADGCGIRINKQKEKTNVENLEINKENKSQVLKEMNRLGFSVNELGYGEIREKISNIVYGFDGNGMDHYIEEIYTDYFVYSQYNNMIESRTRKLYKQNYSIGNDNEVILKGSAVNVKREVSYSEIPVTNNKVKTERIIKKNSKMCTDCVKKLADSLINNKATAWSEADREYLESQTEEVLEKMTPPVISQEQQVNVVKPTREDILAIFSEKPMSTDEFLAFASSEVRSQIQEGLNIRTNQKLHLIGEIIANADQWTEDELNMKELSELQKIYKAVTKDLGETVFTGAGSLGGKTIVKTNVNKPKTDVMLPPGIKVQTN
jgi:hypothetical protein